MSWIEIIADRKIRDAQEEGVFDNLPGKGQPLNLDFDPRVPPEQRAAYRLMKEARLVPGWIEIEKDIRERFEKLSAALDEFSVRREEAVRALSEPRRREDEELLDRRRDLFLLQTAQASWELNRIIDRFNLLVPIQSRQRLRIRIRERIAEMEARFPRFHAYEPGEEPAWQGLLDEARPPTQMSNRIPALRRRGSIG
jgi:hypothetical protein